MGADLAQHLDGSSSAFLAAIDPGRATAGLARSGADWLPWAAVAVGGLAGGAAAWTQTEKVQHLLASPWRPTAGRHTSLHLIGMIHLRLAVRTMLASPEASRHNITPAEISRLLVFSDKVAGGGPARGRGQPQRSKQSAVGAGAGARHAIVGRAAGGAGLAAGGAVARRHRAAGDAPASAGAPWTLAL